MAECRGCGVIEENRLLEIDSGRVASRTTARIRIVPAGRSNFTRTDRIAHVDAAEGDRLIARQAGCDL